MSESYSPAVQRATVEALVGEGNSLDKIAEDHPELAAGVALVREAATKPARRRGSGSTVPGRAPRFTL